MADDFASTEARRGCRLGRPAPLLHPAELQFQHGDPLLELRFGGRVDHDLPDPHERIHHGRESQPDGEAEHRNDDQAEEGGDLDDAHGRGFQLKG